MFSCASYAAVILDQPRPRLPSRTISAPGQKSALSLRSAAGLCIHSWPFANPSDVFKDPVCLIFTSRANRITGEKISGCFGCAHICQPVNYRGRGLTQHVSKSDSLGISLHLPKSVRFVRYVILKGAVSFLRTEKGSEKPICGLLSMG